MKTTGLVLAACCSLFLSCASSSVSCEGVNETMASLRSAAIASEAYAVDNNKYPLAANMSELGPLVSPAYIRTLPTSDTWGTEFRYQTLNDQKEYQFRSAGPDRLFETADDIVFVDGSFTQSPAGCTQQ